MEGLFVVGAGLIASVSGRNILGALGLSAGILVAATLAAWLILFMAQPFLDHRKLVWEREHAQEMHANAQKEFEQLMHTLHFRVYLHDRSLWSGNEIRTLRDVIQKGHSFDPQHQFTQIRGQLAGIADQIRLFGQPYLADEFEVLVPEEEDKAPPDAQGCLALVEPADIMIRQWASGAIVFPPFQKDLGDVNRSIPHFWSP